MKNEKKYTWLLPIRTIIFIASFTVVALLLKTNFADISRWWSLIASAVNIVIIAILLLVCKAESITFSNLIRYKKGKSKWSISVLIVGLMIVIGMGGMYLAGFVCYGVFPYMAPAMMVAPIPLWLAIVNLFVLPITTTLAEDGLYLGVGVNSIKNKWIAILLPAFLYALQHSFMPTLWDGKYMAYRFLSFLPLTLWICWYYHKKGNPLPIMVGHGLLNIATATNILFTSAFPEIYEKML